MNDLLIIIGCAPCWEEDLNNLLSVTASHDVMAIGLDCPYKGEVDYFASYHTDDIPLYAAKRKRENLNIDYIIISHIAEKENHIDFILPYKSPAGSSAMLGAMAGIRFGYKKIVLCGCPLQGFNQKKHPYVVFQNGWKARFNVFNGIVKSMSGFTQELLGAPTEEWLKLV